MPAGPVVAAGAVCWRQQDGVVRVLLIHREHHHDVSLPKGKLDPGEALPQTAVREVNEETGYRVSLGVPLGNVEYVMPSGKDKVVHYWAAKVSRKEFERAGKFRPNDEVAAIEWVTIEEARTQLTYERDVAVLDRFAARVEAGEHRGFSLVVLRHAKTVPGRDWKGSDATRPLLPVGRTQAKAAASPIAAYGPKKIVSSTAARCLATVEPLSTRTRVGVTPTAAISQEAHERGRSDVESVVRRRIERAKTAVICSHGPVLPDIVAGIANAAGGDASRFNLRGAAMLSVGDFAVLHISEGQLVAVETHRNPVAA